MVINKRLPILEGDQIVLLGPKGPSSPLTWDVDEQSGRLVVDLPESDVAVIDHAWSLQVQYQLQ